MERPLSVVTSDQEALGSLLAIHAGSSPRILDTTANTGKIWRGLPYRPARLDCRDEFAPDVVGSFDNIPAQPGQFTVLVFDPPHLTDHGRNGIGYGKRYGTDVLCFQGPTNISFAYPGFLREAARVLPKGGLILAKIADQTHSRRYQWQSGQFIQAAERHGFVLVDMAIKVRPRAVNDPKWKTVRTMRKVHSYWIALKKG